MALTGHWLTGEIPQKVMQEIRLIEKWILSVLSSPVPVPGKTKLELEVLPRDVMPIIEFALPDHTRFTLMDFPLHLPIEMLDVDTVIRILTAIMLEYKVNCFWLLILISKSLGCFAIAELQCGQHECNGIGCVNVSIRLVLYF